MILAANQESSKRKYKISMTSVGPPCINETRLSPISESIGGVNPTSVIGNPLKEVQRETALTANRSN